MSEIVNKDPHAQVAAPRAWAPANHHYEALVRLADDRLVLGHRVSEWCGHAPIVEEDIALSNIALDLVGQASSLLDLAARAEGRGRDADALAYFRDETHFRNALLLEQPNGDFATTMARQFLFDAFSVPLLDQLAQSAHEGLAAVAMKAIKEDRYHLRHSSEWVIRLGDGTQESHDRMQAAFDELWRFTGELFDEDEVDTTAAASHGISIDREAIRQQWDATVGQVLARATLERPAEPPMRRGGRRGFHTEHLGHMLAVMQSVARAHPGANW